jgi:hypothetical protein
VFEAHGNRGVRFTMEQPWSMLLMDDARVIHETTPIQSQELAQSAAGVAHASDAPTGVRDTLVLTYRARGFQGPEEAGG